MLIYKIKELKNLDIYKNLYFVVGSMVSKAISFLAIPLVIFYYNENNYAHYILIYSYVQAIAVISVLGINNAVIPFWLDYKNKEEFISSMLITIVCMSIIFFIPLSLLLFYLIPIPIEILNPKISVLLILLFAFIYNFFVVGQALLRVQSKQKDYFWVSIISSVIYLIFLFILGENRYLSNNLLVLAIINISVLLFNVLISFKLSGIGFSFTIDRKKFNQFFKSIIKFSIPITAYMFIGSLPFTMDKWIISKYFEIDVFSKYVISFQFAFAVNIMSNVINVYNTPNVCELYHLEDVNGLKRNLKINYYLITAGIFILGALIFSYANITGISLSLGYWILLIAFFFQNIFSINTNFLIAKRRTLLLTFTGLSGLFSCLLTLMLSVYLKSEILVYVSQIFNGIVISLISFKSIMKDLK